MKISNAIVLAASLTCGATAYADTQDIKSSNNQIGVQATSTHVNYTETNDGRFGTTLGKFDTESGGVPGYTVSVSAMKDWILGNDYVQFQYGRNQGHTDYTGALQSGGAFGSIVRQNDATLTDYSLRLGKGYAVNQDVMLTPFGELGHHEWQRGVNAGETYTNSYFGVGALAQYSSVTRLVWSASALLGRTYSADIDVAGPRGFSGALGNADLYKAGLSADYAFTQNFHANVGVNYTSFKYGASANFRVGHGVAWEPDSKTGYTTIGAGIGYAF